MNNLKVESMKKMTMSALLLSVIVFGSCRRAYTCSCSSSTGGSTSVVTETKLSKQSLKDARTECDKGDAKLGTLETECEIKL